MMRIAPRWWWLMALLAALLLLLLPLGWGYRAHLRSSIDIARPPTEVFDYVTTPGNWPQWHPSSLAVHGSTDHPLDTGEQVTEDFIVAGRRGQVVWTVIAREPERRWVIRGQVAGGGEGIISYTLTPIASGTHFQRDFDYTFRQLLLIILDRVQLRARVRAESEAALQHLKANLEH